MKTGFNLCRAVLAVTDTTAPEQAVLMVLAIMADNTAATCFPPINGPSGLTGKTKLSERTVQRSLQALKEAGHIEWQDKPGKGRIYTVHPRSTPATVAPHPRQSDTRHSGTPATQAETPATVAPKLPITTIPSEANASSGKRPRAIDHELPDDWQPKPFDSASECAKVMENWPPGETPVQLEHFRAHHAKHGAKFKDWQAAWRTWVLNSRKFGNGLSRQSHSQQPGVGRNRAAAAPLRAILADKRSQSAFGTG